MFATILDDALSSLGHTMSIRLNALLLAIVLRVVGQGHRRQLGTSARSRRSSRRLQIRLSRHQMSR